MSNSVLTSASLTDGAQQLCQSSRVALLQGGEDPQEPLQAQHRHAAVANLFPCILHGWWDIGVPPQEHTMQDNSDQLTVPQQVAKITITVLMLCFLGLVSLPVIFVKRVITCANVILTIK